MPGIAASALATVAACSPPEETDAASPVAAAAVETGSVATEEVDPPPDQFSGTAWRSVAEDGSRYTTYFDPGGRYRDLRNGDPWQSGAWTLNDDDGEQLCFTPDGDAAEQTCWSPGALDGDVLFASNQAGRRIELRRVAYTAPEEEPTEDGEDSEEGEAPE